MDSQSIDDAVSALMGSDTLNNDEHEAGADDATLEQDHSGPDSPDLDLDIEDGADEPTEIDVEGDEEGGEAEEPIPAPEFWDADHRARFANLSRDAQKLVAEQAKHGTAAIARSMNEAANARKDLESKAKRFEDSYSKLEALVPLAEQRFASKWANVDQSTWAQAYQHDPEATAKARIEYEADMAEVARLQSAARDAEQQAMTAYVAEQSRLLTARAETDKAVARLVDPQNGSKVKSELAEYLVRDYSIPIEAITRIGAAEMELAYKAMLYDRAVQAKSSKSVAKVPATQAMRPPTQATRSTQGSKLETAHRRLGQTGSIDDAVAALKLQNQRRTNKR